MDEDGGFLVSNIETAYINVYKCKNWIKKYVLGHGAHIPTVLYVRQGRMEDARYGRRNGGRWGIFNQ